MARDQKEHAGGDQLGSGELLPLVLGLDQSRQEVLAGVPSALRDELGEVGAELLVRLLGPGQRVGRDDGIDRMSEVQRPPPERVPVFFRDGQHVADHGDRQRIREVRHDVHLASLRRLVQQRGHELFHARPQGLHHSRREGLADQGPQPVMIRRIEEEQRRLELVRLEWLRERLQKGFVHVRLASVARPAGVPYQSRVVPVPGQDPHTGERLVHRVPLAQLPVRGIRIGVRNRVEWVEPGEILVAEVA